jgi:hypothetical protein
MMNAPMVECFSVVVASSVLEEKNNSLSMLQIVEQMNIPEAALGFAVPFEAVSTWLFDATLGGRSLETRLVLTSVADGALRMSQPQPITLDPALGEGPIRVRMRAQGVPIPKQFGNVYVSMQWRFSEDEEWSISTGRWYFSVRQLEMPTSLAENVVERAPLISPTDN